MRIENNDVVLKEEINAINDNNKCKIWINLILFILKK